MRFDPFIPAEERRKLLRRLTKTARRIGRGVRVEFAEDLLARQIAWPETCPLSEPELRGEIETLNGELKAIFGQMEALSSRAKELYKRLPEPSRAEHREVPESLYYAVTDALSAIADTPEDAVSYVEERLAETPESLRQRWLRYELKKCLDVINDPESEESLERLVNLLCGEDVEAAEDPAGD